MNRLATALLYVSKGENEKIRSIEIHDWDFVVREKLNKNRENLDDGHERDIMNAARPQMIIVFIIFAYHRIL